MKYLEVSDFHFSPKWADVSKQAGAAVLAAARRHEVDFIAVPGDLYDAPIMVTDKGGINILRAIVKSWLNYCPVVAIYGTPSHDGPGCYGPLEDLGLVVLEPGKTYGMYGGDYRGDFVVCPVTGNAPDAILFGIPELNKQTIQSELHLSAEQANAEATSLLADYILQYVAPMRSKYPLLPAFGLLHGNVSDAHKENNPDIIMRSSDIVIHTEDLSPANLTRWSLGHIHTPWESSVINAGYPGYPGMDSNPWGKRDFTPAMNLIETHKREVPGYAVNNTFVNFEHITKPQRIPYGTPERRKISTPLKSYDPAIAYWLHTADATASPPAGHPWSRITFDETKIETRRVTAEQAAEVKTLADLYRLIDPTVSERVLALVDTIPQTANSNQSHVDLAMTHLRVTGCTFFRGRTVEFDLSKLHDGVTSIRGGNGSGKSSLLSFCSPYPLVIGKDTSSGRPSAIKDFFSEKDSMIEKSFMVNGAKHDHLITIKGAHTQSPKTECYLYIDGASQLDCGTFDEMMETCERLYGPYQDYLLTTFYVQPLQGKTGSSLMSATMTDIRNLVQSIAGIDREAEKRHALDKLAASTKEVERLRNWITGAEQFVEDEVALLARITEHQDAIPSIEARKKQAEADGLKLRTDLDIAQALKSASDAESARKTKDTNRIGLLSSQIDLKRKTVAGMQSLVAEREANKAKIAANISAVAHNREISEAEYRNRTALREFNQKNDELTQKVQWIINEWQNDCAHVQHSNEDAMRDYVTNNKRLSQSILSLETQIKDLDARVSRINIPCPSCGYIAPDVKQSIESLKNDRHGLVERLDVHKASLAALNPPKPTVLPEMPAAIAELKAQIGNTKAPDLEPIEKRWPELSAQELATINARIIDADSAASQIATLNAAIDAMQNEIAALSVETYVINATIAMDIADINANIDAKRREWTACNAELVTAQVSIKSLDEKIAKAREQRIAIAKAQADLLAASTACDDWRYISGMLQASKIPALELELLLDSIDAETTRILEAYQEARFSVATETQGAGKAGSVDRFDIVVHDSETGDSRSFMKFSPGQKAFFADAYVKALVRQRNERAHRSYKPVIMDESDGPIEPGLVADYYEMQRRYWMDCPVLAVSHSPASHEHIEYAIDIEELKA